MNQDQGIDLSELIHRRHAVPETNTRNFGPELGRRKKNLKPQPDYAIKKRRRPVAGDDKQPTQQTPSN